MSRNPQNPEIPKSPSPQIPIKKNPHPPLYQVNARRVLRTGSPSTYTLGVP